MKLLYFKKIVSKEIWENQFIRCPMSIRVYREVTIKGRYQTGSFQEINNVKFISSKEYVLPRYKRRPYHQYKEYKFEINILGSGSPSKQSIRRL